MGNQATEATETQKPKWINFWPAKWALQEEFWKNITINLVTAYLIAAVVLVLTNVARGLVAEDMAAVAESVRPIWRTVFALIALYVLVLLKRAWLRSHPDLWRYMRVPYFIGLFGVTLVMISFAGAILLLQIVELMRAVG
ncbi:hypothetical protein RF644_18115 [Kocuria sp. CPCC 205258]|uniref:hypothetical protein n=1 Tax=Kocuria sp. CPCC 205258 TaxID=3073552 RepID=UPI0034D4FD37